MSKLSQNLCPIHKATDDMISHIPDVFPVNTRILVPRHNEITKNLKYNDRVFDALARMFEVLHPCCAVLPLIDETNPRLIKKLYISFNSSLLPKSKEAISFDNIAKAIITGLQSTSMLTEEKIWNLVCTFIKESPNTYYNFFAKVQGFCDKILTFFETLTTESPDQRTSLLEKSKQTINELKEKVKGEKGDKDFPYYTGLYHECLFITQEILGNYKDIMPKVMKRIEYEHAKSCLFKICRLYLDSKKLIDLFHHNYELANEDLIVVLENPYRVHAEINLIHQIEEVSARQITYEQIVTNKRHVGISKLSCEICFYHFNEINLSSSLSGCHGITDVGSWKLSGYFISNKGLFQQVGNLISKIVGDFSNHTKVFNNPKLPPLKQDTELSDEEEGITTFLFQDPLYAQIKNIAMLGDLTNIHDNWQEYE